MKFATKCPGRSLPPGDRRYQEAADRRSQRHDRRRVRGGSVMMRYPIVWTAVLGLASALTGCVTREFVRLEVERSQATLRPAVDGLVSDVGEHKLAVRDLTVMVTASSRDAELATRASIEALGRADVAVGSAADAMGRATLALTRADAANALAQQALAEAGRTDERLTRIWTRRGRPSVVGALVLRFGADDWTLDARAEGPAGCGRSAPRESGVAGPSGGLRRRPWRATAQPPSQPVAGGSRGPLSRSAGRRAESFPNDRPGSYPPGGGNSTLESRRQNRRVVVRVLDPS